MSDNPLKTLIIGSGPAGLAAALYAARANLEPVVLSGMDLGGQVSLTFEIENYPGFPNGVGGQKLVQLFQEQAEKFGAEIIFDSATNVDLSSRPFRVETYGDIFHSQTIIIATGATPVKLGIKGEEEYTGKGVSYCATCDGHFFKEKDVIVVGGGDSALEEALFLTRYAKKIKIIHRRDKLRANALLQKRAFNNQKIEFMWNSNVIEINGEDVVKSILVHNNSNNKITEIPIDGVFIFIGHKPNSELFQNQIELDEQGYIIINKYMETNVDGVFAAGEIADSYFRQVITSAGMGTAAAMRAIYYLESNSM